MQDRMCGRCDCILRAGKYPDGTRWYKESPSRCQGWPTRIPLLDRGQGAPTAKIWVLAAQHNLPDRETDRSKELRQLFEEIDGATLHERTCGGVVGLPPLIVTGCDQGAFWENLLGVDRSGGVQAGRGYLWRQWLAGNLWVTTAIKCYTSGPVPAKNLDLFAGQCAVHLQAQFERGCPEVLLVAGKLSAQKFFGLFHEGKLPRIGHSVEIDALGGMNAWYLPDPSEERGPKAWALAEQELGRLEA